MIPDIIDKDYELFEDFILEDDHPCIMAQTVFKLDHIDLHTYSNFGSREVAVDLLRDIKEYLLNYDFESNDFYTFLAVFEDEPKRNEQDFESMLWQQLMHLHEVDDKPWDKRVSNNPEDHQFSFSIGGRAFYIVGLHPGSSRKARQYPKTAIAFNLHWQFEKLREMGTYKRVRNTIRKRDIANQGTINPMLEDYGNSSEARQYSGRAVDQNWKCPFHDGN